MKKQLSKLACLLMAAAMLLALAACGPANADGTPTPGASNTPAPTPAPTEAQENKYPAKDWTGFTGWLEENWDSKDISYQFTGSWSMDGEYAMKYDVLINLYSDGSLLADQYGAGRASYTYYGQWTGADTEDGVELTLDTICEAPLQNVPAGAPEGMVSADYVAYEYEYILYEESDGGFSFGYTINLAPGQYFRTADVKGSSAVTYATVADFRAAVDAAASAPGDETQTGGDETQTGGEEKSYPAHTLVLPFTPDTSEQLKTEFYCDAGTWGVAFAGAGTYEATDSDELLFSFVSDGSENYHLDFKANGTYEYSFTTVGLTESGTWVWADWALTVTTAGGNMFTGSIAG